MPLGRQLLQKEASEPLQSSQEYLFDRTHQDDSFLEYLF